MTERKGAGRPTALTELVEAKVLEALRGGNFRQTAALYAGISPSTLRVWMKRGKDEPKSEFGNFRRRVREAEQAAQIRAVALVLKAAAEDARHAEWWLERKFPELWGRKDSVKAELSGKVTVGGLAELLQAGQGDDDADGEPEVEAEETEPEDPGAGA